MFHLQIDIVSNLNEMLDEKRSATSLLSMFKSLSRLVQGSCQCWTSLKGCPFISVTPHSIEDATRNDTRRYSEYFCKNWQI